MVPSDPVTRIVEAVAAADGVDPTELESLYPYVDPGVLQSLSEQDRGEWTFTFQFSDHQVTFTHESTVLVDGVAHPSEASLSEHTE